MTIIGLVAVVLLILGFFLLQYIDTHFTNSNEVKKLFIYTGIFGFSLTTFFAFFLSTKITQPLLQMKKAADMITKGEYDSRVLIRSSDEIGELAKTFNHMAEELRVTIQDLNYEKGHLSSILRSMADAVISFDADGIIMSMNPPGERIVREWCSFSWNEEEGAHEVYSEGGNENDSPAVSQDTKDGSSAVSEDGSLAVLQDTEEVSNKYVPEPLQPLFDSVIKGTKELTSKITVHHEVWSVVMAPLYSQDNAVRGAVAVLRDVTEEYRLEKLRKDFVANVSHELRTPLSMLQGYSEALLDDIAVSPEERKELVQVIHDESLRMGRLVGDLLDLARMEARHMELSIQKVDISSLMQRVYRKFSVLSKERSIQLELYIEDAEPLIVHGDEDRLEQVLTNLLDNALRHTSQGSRVFMRAMAGKIRQAKAVKLEIEDQGHGIPQEDLPYIFERFYKADKARTRGNTGGGTGLGLAIVKNIVNAHHGLIKAESTVGKGTIFSITIPCRWRRSANQAIS
jgi:two-component system sensor histidine kinase ResE